MTNRYDVSDQRPMVADKGPMTNAIKKNFMTNRYDVSDQRPMVADKGQMTNGITYI